MSRDNHYLNSHPGGGCFNCAYAYYIVDLPPRQGGGNEFWPLIYHLGEDRGPYDKPEH